MSGFVLCVFVAFSLATLCGSLVDRAVLVQEPLPQPPATNDDCGCLVLLLYDFRAADQTLSLLDTLSPFSFFSFLFFCLDGLLGFIDYIPFTLSFFF